jgi:hypothetical protein
MPWKAWLIRWFALEWMLQMVVGVYMGWDRYLLYQEPTWWTIVKLIACGLAAAAWTWGDLWESETE